MVDDNNYKQKTDRSQQYLANERTFLSWVRTCIALIGLGFIISKFSFFLAEFRIITQRYTIDSPELNSYQTQTQSSIDQISNWIGIGTVSLAILLILFALKNYLNTHRSIETQTYSPNQMTLYLTTAIIVLLSVFVFVYLVLVPST